jgi:hypothetical protein
MRKRIFIAAFLAIMGGFFLYSCSYDTLVPEKINPDQKVSFSTTIQPVFTQKCITCHAGSPAPDLRAGKSYASLKAGNYINTASPNQSKIYTEIAPNGGMYQYSNDPTDSQKILLWIQQGALDN